MYVDQVGITGCGITHNLCSAVLETQVSVTGYGIAPDLFGPVPSWSHACGTGGFLQGVGLLMIYLLLFLIAIKSYYNLNKLYLKSKDINLNLKPFLYWNLFHFSIRISTGRTCCCF